MGLAEKAVGMVNSVPHLDHRRLVCDMRVMNTPAPTDRYKGGPSWGAHRDDGLRMTALRKEGKTCSMPSLSTPRDVCLRPDDRGSVLAVGLPLVVMRHRRGGTSLLRND
jgi:hypothetical protein